MFNDSHILTNKIGKKSKNIFGTKNNFQERKNELKDLLETIRKNKKEILSFFDSGKTTNVFSYNSFMMNEITPPVQINSNIERCTNCLHTAFVRTGGQQYCRNCGQIKKYFISDTGERPKNSIATLNKDDIAGYSRRKDNYNKAKQFRRYVEEMVGIAQIIIPSRFFTRIFPDYIKIQGSEIDEIDNSYIEKMLSDLGVYKIFSNDIPGIFFTITRRKFINLSPEEIDKIVELYTAILKVNSIHSNLARIPLHKFMFPKIMAYLNIPFDTKYVDYIKGEEKGIIMEERWRILISFISEYFKTDNYNEDDIEPFGHEIFY